MCNRNALEFLGDWDMLHNPAFKGVEFDTFLHDAGANRFIFKEILASFALTANEIFIEYIKSENLSKFSSVYR